MLHVCSTHVRANVKQQICVSGLNVHIVNISYDAIVEAVPPAGNQHEAVKRWAGPRSNRHARPKKQRKPQEPELTNHETKRDEKNWTEKYGKRSEKCVPVPYFIVDGLLQ